MCDQHNFWIDYKQRLTTEHLLWHCTGVVLDLHAELYKESEAGENDSTSYLIVLTTNKGMIKLDMMDDYQRYRTWSMTINHMLTLSTSFTKYELQFYKNWNCINFHFLHQHILYVVMLYKYCRQIYCILACVIITEDSISKLTAKLLIDYMGVIWIIHICLFLALHKVFVPFKCIPCFLMTVRIFSLYLNLDQLKHRKNTATTIAIIIA